VCRQLPVGSVVVDKVHVLMSTTSRGPGRPSGHELTLTDVQAVFNLPRASAAERYGFKTTAFKNACRHLGVQHKALITSLFAVAALHCIGVQAFIATPQLYPARGLGTAVSLGLRSGRRVRSGAHSSLGMQLEFPRREAQQSREYNVAKVRGGYYMSDKEGDAPLEEVIRSKMADVGDAAEAQDPAGQGQGKGQGQGQGLSDEEFAALMDRQGVGTEGDVIDGTLAPKYMPSLQPNDPIIKEIYRLKLASKVKSFELLDSRWNGNEVLQYLTDVGSLFVKMNRVEDSSVFMAEVQLSFVSCSRNTIS